jgi:hypothetical protein
MTTTLPPNTAPTVWLLDVDDTINGWEAGWYEGDLKSGSAHCLGEKFNLHWSGQLMRWITRLHRTGNVQVVWSTTWCVHPEIRGLETLLGLPIFDTAFETPPGRFVADLKFQAARDVLASGRRLIWTDDSEVPTEGTFAHQELTGDDRALLIAPKKHSCLRPDHLARIDDFIALGARVRP